MSYNKIPADLKSLYPHLPYHNLEHTELFDWTSCPSNEAYYAAVFHDFIYDPLTQDNEEKSIGEYLKYSTRDQRVDDAKVKDLILSTKDHVRYFDSTDPDMVWLHRNDLACFRQGANIEKNEQNIFREYQFVENFQSYKSARLKILNYYYKHPLISKSVIEDIVAYLTNWKPKYGLFAGSFDPYHRGHHDIVQQAERVFDKVIIAQGQNEDKGANNFDLANVPALKYHHKEKYTGSLFDYLNKKKGELGNLTLIRGLRNCHDLHDESAIFNFGQDMTNVPFVYFISKSVNLHISSSSIRKFKSLGKDITQYLPSTEIGSL